MKIVKFCPITKQPIDILKKEVLNDAKNLQYEKEKKLQEDVYRFFLDNNKRMALDCDLKSKPEAKRFHAVHIFEDAFKKGVINEND